MKRFLFAVAASFILLAPSRATTLAPEIKAYDFCRAYYLEDGGITLVPQDGFYCPEATKTPEGLHIAPGQTFIQFDPARLVMEVYKFTRLTPDERRGYFHENRYRYKVVRTPENKWRIIRQQYIDSDDFYLTMFRQWQWLDGVFPDFEVHPGEQLWRTRGPT
jgi:hypothetical protein